MPDGFWNAAYWTTLYDRLTPSLYRDSLAAAAAAVIAAEPARLLDAGCGSGQLLEPLAPWLRRSEGWYVGVDRAAAGLRLCHRRAARLGVSPRCRTVLADMTKPGAAGAVLGPEPFGAAVLHFVLYTILPAARRRMLLDTVGAHLAAGGRLICCVPSRDYAWSEICRQSGTGPVLRAIHRLVGLGRVERAVRRGRYLAYTADELHDELDAAGYSVAMLESTYGGNGWRAVAVKAGRLESIPGAVP